MAPVAAIVPSSPKLAGGPSTTHDAHADDFAAVLAGLTPKTQPVEEHAQAPHIEHIAVAPKDVVPPVHDRQVVVKLEAKPHVKSAVPAARPAPKAASPFEPHEAREACEVSERPEQPEAAVGPVRAATAVAPKDVKTPEMKAVDVKPPADPETPAADPPSRHEPDAKAPPEKISDEEASAAPHGEAAEPASSGAALRPAASQAALEKIAALVKEAPQAAAVKADLAPAAKAPAAPVDKPRAAAKSDIKSDVKSAARAEAKADVKSIVQSVIARAAAIVIDRTQRAVSPSTEEAAPAPAAKPDRAPPMPADRVQVRMVQAEPAPPAPAPDRAPAAQTRDAQDEPVEAARPESVPAGRVETGPVEHAPAQPVPAATAQTLAAPVALPQIATKSAAPSAQPGAAPAPVLPRTAYSAPDVAALAAAIAQKSAGGGRKSFEIRLDPPELGRVEVHLSVSQDGKAEATLYADKPATLALLQRDSQNLERALKDAGLDVSNSSLNFSLKDGQRQGDGGGASTAHTRSLPDAVVARSEAVNASLASLNLASDGARLDIVV